MLSLTYVNTGKIPTAQREKVKEAFVGGQRWTLHWTLRLSLLEAGSWLICRASPGPPWRRDKRS